MSPSTSPDPSALLREATTLVLATADPDPWSAPVWFVLHRGRLWFLSSPRSRHVQAALASGRCAGSVHRDAARWADLEGIQLAGTLVEAPPGPEHDEALRAYLERFPDVAGLVATATAGAPGAPPRVRLYALEPREAFHVHNRDGLQGRRPIPVPR